MSKLVIIESPGKLGTIKKYLGKEYDVFATKGHIRDLPAKSLAVDIQNNFAPKYVIMPDKKQTVAEMKKKAEHADEIYLATDPDREGEAISWHVQNILGLNSKQKNRIAFNEISKSAIEKALKEPREIDMNLVDAQQARRVLDRLVGYQLSPYLAKKISHKNLSAGRVQSVALKLVVDRENEIRNFVPQESFVVNATLSKKSNPPQFVATLINKNNKKYKIASEDEAKQICESIKNSTFKVVDVKKSITKSSAKPPFTTSTMQQDALNKMGLTLKRTSMAAQNLYEGIELPQEGKTALITYIRTDSVRVSQEAQKMAKEFIIEKFGAEYVPTTPNTFKGKKNSQDAHEAIRPVHIELTPEKVKASLTSDQYKLYKLIFERFLASQMSEATFNSVAVTINVDESGENANVYGFKATGRTPLFAGHLAAYNYDNEKSNDTKEDADETAVSGKAKLPSLEIGDELEKIKLDALKKLSKPPLRYDDGTLVKALEEKGIGRPATYGPTIATIYARQYVDKEGKYVKPTELGEVVNDVLDKNFSNIINVKFTAEMEEKLDEIENGGKTWQEEIRDFYSSFEESLKNAGHDTEKIKIQSEITDIICEKCGKPFAIRTGKFGKFLGCTGYPECKNIRKLEKIVGKCPKCGGEVAEKKSKKGTLFYGCNNYPNCDFISWNIPLDEKCPKCKAHLELKKTREGKLKVCSSKDCDFKQLIMEGENK